MRNLVYRTLSSFFMFIAYVSPTFATPITPFFAFTGTDRDNNLGEFVVSHDKGLSWSVFKGAPIDSRSMSCVGSDNKSNCVIAAGFNLSTSFDGGISWKVSNEFYSTQVSCSGDNPATAVCAAAGLDYPSSGPGTFRVSQDGGQSWVKPIVSNLNNTWGIFPATSCTGTGVNTVCMVAGQNNLQTKDTLFSPIIAVSLDRGHSWQLKSIQHSSTTEGYTFYDASCTGSGATAICVAAGTHWTTPFGVELGLLVVSTNGGRDWDQKSYTHKYNKHGDINSISCSGEKTEAVCAATGTYMIDLNSRVPFVVTSSQGVTSWTETTFDNLLSSTDFEKTLSIVNCTGGGAQSVCVAGGKNILAIKNGNTPWTIKTMNFLSEANDYIITTIKCSGSGAKAICMAGGFYYKHTNQPTNDNMSPFIIKSIDGGNKWSMETISGLSNNGYIGS